MEGTKIVTTEPFVVSLTGTESAEKAEGGNNLMDCSLDGVSLIHAPITAGDAVAPGVLEFVTPYVAPDGSSLVRLSNLDCRMETEIQ
jgi:hypothetical protein